MGALKILRRALGQVVVTVDSLCPVNTVSRDKEKQKEMDEKCKQLTLYQFYGCPFCVKVRRYIRHLNLVIETREASSGTPRLELLEQGGQVKVPCLRIENDDGVHWLYESDAIIAYLHKHFS